jgi:fluoroquinolone resistance protein
VHWEYESRGYRMGEKGRTMEEKLFDKIDFSLNPLIKGEYENCVFANSSFLNSDLTDILFMECEFENCDLSMAKLLNTTLRDIVFKNCKMLGIRFDSCNEFCFSVKFDNCNLTHSSFYGVKLKKTLLRNNRLFEVDFTNCDLTNSVFDNCDFTGAVFENTVIEKADFRNSFNFSIDPERNRMKKARFSSSGLSGLLQKYDIEID